MRLENGDVYAWGANTSGQLGDETMVQNIYPVKVGGDYIDLDKYHITIKVGDNDLKDITGRYNLFFNVYKDVDSTASISARSLDESVVRVENGKLVPIAAGKTKVIVSAKGKNAICEVTVLGADTATVKYLASPDVASGEGFTVILKANRTVHCW